MFTFILLLLGASHGSQEPDIEGSASSHWPRLAPVFQVENFLSVPSPCSEREINRVHLRVRLDHELVAEEAVGGDPAHLLGAHEEDLVVGDAAGRSSPIV